MQQKLFVVSISIFVSLISIRSPDLGGFPHSSDGKESACMQETWVRFLDWEVSLEKEMATHSSILAWRIPEGL